MYKNWSSTAVHCEVAGIFLKEAGYIIIAPIGVSFLGL